MNIISSAMHILSAKVQLITKNMDSTEIQRFVTAVSTFAWENDYRQFCQICGFREDFYSEEKWQELKELNRLLGKFDANTITKIVRSGLKLPIPEEAEV